MNLRKWLKEIIPKSADRKPFLVLLTAPIIFTLWKYQGSQEFFNKQIAGLFSDSADKAFLATAYYGISSLVFLFLIPSTIIKTAFKEKLSGYGVRWADGKFGLKIILIAYPVILLAMIPASFDPQYQALNPMYPDAGKDLMTFFIYAVFYGFYYIGWEFFFRGFMLFGLRERFGDTFAILIQTLPSVIAHIGRPEGEMLSSILAGIVFGYLVLRSRTLWYVLILHWMIGLGCDVLCLLARN